MEHEITPSPADPTQVHPPTAIFHSVTAWLTKPHSKDDFPELVVSKGTVLEVYALLYVWDMVVMAGLVPGVGMAVFSLVPIPINTNH